MELPATKSSDLVIIGAGGHGREVLDVVRYATDDAVSFLGFVADEPPDISLLAAVDAEWLGPVELLRDLDVRFVVAIGNPSARRTLHERATGWGRTAAVLWHRTAHRAAGVVAGPGTVVLANASVTSNVQLGLHVHVNLNATVAHDCQVGDFATINPGAHLNGNVTVGEAATIGSGAVVRQGITIGPRAMVGAGAVVVADVAADTVVLGVPARPR